MSAGVASTLYPGNVMTRFGTTRLPFGASGKCGIIIGRGTTGTGVGTTGLTMGRGIIGGMRGIGMPG
jgi:hypothetical protein